MKKYVKAALMVAAVAAIGMSGVLLMPKFTANKTIEHTIAQNGVTIHYKWNDSTTPHFYYTNMNGEGISMSYPGIPMEQEAEGWYSYTIKDVKDLKFRIVIEDIDFQTADISCEAGEYWFDEDRFVKNPTEGYEEAMAGRDAKRTVTDEEAKEVIADTMRAMAVTKTDVSNEGIVIHYPSDWDKVQLYAWNGLPNDVDFDWPGEVLEKDEQGYYTYIFKNVSKVNFLFTNGTEQSEEFTLTKSGEYIYYDGKWVSGGLPPSTDTPSTGTPAPTPSGSNTTPAPFERGDFRDETIYFLMTTRFYDGDESNNVYCRHDADVGNDKNNDPAWRGDFKGLIEKLDYIKALGFSAIWITPVVENDSDYDYHGYHAYNFKKVDSRYESSDCTYQDLINAAHKKGMKVIQDIVLNHTCSYGEENLLQLDRNISDIWKRAYSVSNPGVDPNNIFHHNGGIGSSYESYICQTGTMDANCVDLETENPTVYNYLIDAYTKYINMGVDAFRIDTVKHISRLTFNNTFLPAFKKAGGESFYMFGEACVLRNEIWNGGLPGISVCFYSWKESKDYAWGDLKTNEAAVEKHFTDQSENNQPTSDNAFLKGNEYHTPDRSQSSGLDLIDFYMHHKFENAGSAFSVALEEDKYFNDSTWSVTYVDSHDYGPNGVSLNQRYTGSQDTWAENLDLMFTFRGIPCIYYGSEIEFKKGKKIDDYFAPLEETGRAYFGEQIEGTVNTTDFGEYSDPTGKIAETLNYPLAKHIQRLNLIRRAVPALRKGQYSTEGVSGSLAYKRRYTDSNTDSFVCVTISGDATFSGVPSGTYVDIVTGDKIDCNGTLTAKCSGKGNMRVYVLQTAGAPNSKIGEDGVYLK